MTQLICVAITQSKYSICQIRNKERIRIGKKEVVGIEWDTFRIKRVKYLINMYLKFNAHKGYEI